jgi:hypothetical protein
VEVPVTVRLYVPTGVSAAVDTVSRLLVDPPGGGVTRGGEKVPTASNGVPPTCNETGELKLPNEVTLIV